MLTAMSISVIHNQLLFYQGVSLSVLNYSLLHLNKHWYPHDSDTIKKVVRQ